MQSMDIFGMKPAAGTVFSLFSICIVSAKLSLQSLNVKSFS